MWNTSNKNTYTQSTEHTINKINNQASIQAIIRNPTLAGSKSDTREYYINIRK